MAKFKVIDNFEEEHGEFETREEAVERLVDLLEMEIEDDGYVRRHYEIIESEV